MKKSMSDGDVHSFSKYDMDFHLALAAISRNPLLARVLTQIRALFLFQEKLLISMPSVMGAALRAHEGILNALQKKEHEGASLLLQEHLTKVERNWSTLKSEIFRQLDTVPEDWQSLSSVFELRRTIEIAAIRHQRYAPAQSPPVEPRELLKLGHLAARSGNIPTYAQLDVDFHLKLVEQSSAPFLSRIIQNVSHIMAFQFLMIMALPKAMESSHGEHEVVYDALMRRDWEGASGSLNHHIVRESQMWNSIIKSQKWARKE
jgi:DNA-binding FadR family transcriptional regulator